MNPALSALLLLIPFLGGGLLLILPGWLEWLRPKDALPIPIDGLYAKEDGIFADRFRQLAKAWWDDPDALGHGRVELAADLLLARPILAETLTTGTGCVILEEAWTRQELTLGPGGRSRALVSDDRIHLERGCSVQRWVHGDGAVALDEDCEVRARITSKERVLLAGGCRSQLISAPLVEWQGPRRPLHLEIPTHARPWIRRRRIQETGKDWAIPRQRGSSDSTVFVNGDLILDSDADVDFPLVVRGNLYIRRGALIAGDIKAHGDLVVEGSTVVGNLCCGGRLLVGEGSWVQGCLRGDAFVWLGDDVVIGRANRPEAVVGDRIILAGNGRVHGRLRALAGWITVEQ